MAGSLLLILAVNAGLYFGLECKIPFYVVAVISLVVYGILVNFFRCLYVCSARKILKKSWLPQLTERLW